MKIYQITAATGFEALGCHEAEKPGVGPKDVLVDMQAWSLNFRDGIMPYGGYPGNDKVVTNPPLVPLSDGAGRVVAVGSEVTRFKVGDRVAGIFFQDWLEGELTGQQMGSALGGAIDGVLAEYRVFDEKGLVEIPANYSYTEAATLPCAAVTAWQSLTSGNIHSGQTILLLGTGGVSIFGLQFAKAFGAKVIITSSSDAKLQRARELGADVTINYRQFPDWHLEVLKATGGEGVDHVLEVGGSGTLEKSFSACKVSGRISLIGALGGIEHANPSLYPVLGKRLSLQGIYVGSREMFVAMNQFIESRAIKPVIDRCFAFDDARSAYQYMQSGERFGKIAISKKLD